MSKTEKCIVIVQRGNKIKARCYEADTIKATVKSSEGTSVKEYEINYNDDLYLASKIALARLFDNKEDEENLDKKIQIKPKFNVGDIVKVVNNGKCYTLYDIWFEKNNCKELLKYYKMGSCCQNGEKYLVVAVGKDDYACYDKTIYAIKDLKGQVCLINETGLKGENE